jgi:hypothetical protein
MTSALKPSGGTHQWRQLRTLHAATLPQPCPRCGYPVQPWEPWDLDHHITPRAAGGDDTHLAPAHRHCNRAANTRPAVTTYINPNW